MLPGKVAVLNNACRNAPGCVCANETIFRPLWAGLGGRRYYENRYPAFIKSRNTCQELFI